MRTVLCATALSLLIAAGAAPAAAQDINIYVYGEDGAELGSAPRGKGHGRHMRERGEHHGMHGGHGQQGIGRELHHEERRGYRDRTHGGDKRRGHRLDRMLDLIETYDQDGDGKVTQAEINKGRADRLAKFDNDGDGRLSLQEYEALWLDAMRERMVDRFQSHDDDGDGQVTVDEFSKRMSRLVLQRDRNDDGAISAEDLRGHHSGRRPMPESADNE